MARVDRLAGGKRAVRAAAQLGEQVTKGRGDDARPDPLVAEAEARQVVLVEEVAERAVAHVVQQPRHAQHLLHQRRRRDVCIVVAQGRIEVAGEPPGVVHRPEGVLEAGVLRPGEDPAGALELVDVAQPLHPPAVEDRLLAHLPR